MFGTLYHTVEHHGQREVAQMLHERGVRADLPIAAGLGRLDLVESFFHDGELRPGADEIWRRTARGGTDATRDEILGDALLAASVNGWREVVSRLLDLGAPIDELRPWGSFVVTPLHGAAWAGWPEAVLCLLQRGANPTVREPTYGGTPRVWAAHAGHAEALAVFDGAGVRE
jgi:ankyrin repeat protein